MAGGKGKSTGGKAGPKEAPGKSQKSHSAKAGLQVRDSRPSPLLCQIRLTHVLPRVLTRRWNTFMLECDRDLGLS